MHEVDRSLRAALVFVLTGDGEPGDAVAQAARSWLAQPHPAWEVVLAAPPEALQVGVGSLRAAGVDDSRIVTVATDPTAAQATSLAAAAAAARAEHLVLMQSPVIGLTHDWLRRLLGYCTDPAIAAAGPIVLAPDGRIKEAGIAIADGIPLFLLHGLDGARGPLGFGTTVINVSAVSGVVATRRETLARLGGLRSEMGDLALIDYCLRAIQDGMRVVTVPDARLRTIEQRPHDQRPPGHLATASSLARNLPTRSLLQPQLRTRPRRLHHAHTMTAHVGGRIPAISRGACSITAAIAVVVDRIRRRRPSNRATPGSVPRSAEPAVRASRAQPCDTTGRSPPSRIAVGRC